eukprot:845754-Prymnesium_polylepis.1
MVASRFNCTLPMPEVPPPQVLSPLVVEPPPKTRPLRMLSLPEKTIPPRAPEWQRRTRSIPGCVETGWACLNADRNSAASEVGEARPRMRTYSAVSAVSAACRLSAPRLARASCSWLTASRRPL